MYKAVFIDMDGTLLSSSHSISTANKEAIHQLIGMGVLVVPISARPLHGILHITQKVLPQEIPVVSLNGSYIYQQGDIIYEAPMALTDTMAVYNEVKSFDTSVMYYSQMEWFATAESALVKKEQRITPVKIIIQPFQETVKYWEQQNTGVNKILIAGDKNLVLDIEQRLLAVHAGKLNIYKSQPSYLEVMQIDASKKKAIEFLMNKYGILQEEIIAIGDNFNDKEMIAFAAKGVAMGNAPHEIKEVADYVTDTNNNDGVAKALQHFFKL